MQVNNFVINYRGHPFTKSIQENTMLYRSIQVIYVAILILAGGNNSINYYLNNIINYNVIRTIGTIE